MSYDEEQHRRSRVVVETPTARREVVQTQTARVPERRGVSAGVIAAVAITAIALTAIIVWALMRNNDAATDNTNVRIATTQPTPVQQPTVIVQQQPVPVQQPPVVVQPAAPPPQTVVVPAPAEPTTRSSTITTGNANTTTRTSGTDDAAIQSNLDKRLSTDPTIGPLNLTATVLDGKVTLIGTVDTPDLKRQAERLVRTIKGVRDVDNQIIVAGGTD